MAKQQSAKSLQQIRRGRALTQRALAERCRVGQSAIAKMERRADWYVSHLREYVAAMGGQLLIVARFPEGEVTISASGEQTGECDVA